MFETITTYFGMWRLPIVDYGPSIIAAAVWLLGFQLIMKTRLFDRFFLPKK